MLRNILKKDLKKRKGVNIILFLFITIATVFLASSVNNILVVGTAVDYYLDYAKIPDSSVYVQGIDENEEMEHWLEKESKETKGYTYGTMIGTAERDWKVIRDGKARVMKNDGATIHISSVETEACKVFSEEGEPVTLKKGEVALSVQALEEKKLKPGDKLQVTIGATEKVFTVKMGVKDAAFGQEMISLERVIVSQEDYDAISADSQATIMGLYYVDTNDAEKFGDEINRQNFKSVVSVINRDMYKMVFAFDMIMASLLILIGVCLILIALLVLRFTLVFTLEEDYREIGIMKASGFRDFAIKKIYLAKYLMIVSVGAILGLALSFPVSSAMVEGVSKNMVMEDGSAYQWINILCAGAIILLVMLFCYLCTRKLNKVSAITAIRNGQTGERYAKRRGIQLHLRKNTPVTIFLGMNDLFSHVKRYLVLIITFCISFILITIPLNTLNTMGSDEMAGKFSIDPNSAVYVKTIELEDTPVLTRVAELKEGMGILETQLAESGYDAEVSCGAFFFFTYTGVDDQDGTRLLSYQVQGPNNQFQEFSEGTAPKQANEIAFSQNVMEKNGWVIGDTVNVERTEKNEKMLITGTYSDYMQMGSSARLSSEMDCSDDLMFGHWSAMVDLKTDRTQEQMKSELKEKLPEYSWVTAQEVVDANVGNIQKSLEQMMLPVTALLCAVIMLITLLMERLFIAREKGEIAMMKSIGFRNVQIRTWQLFRMVCVVITSMIVAVPLSMLSNQFLLRPIFAVMGAEVRIQVVPWQVYGVYPGILLVGIILATVLATRSVKKINIRELNNLE